ncbi:MAG: 3-methyl-2-oxobutanoate dehydrogenase subunit VorB [Armatimonadetes bacterium]|nr:3-methyl-2-oxobutanoate dehydrogenase subunit VorB [Armatimonadota bacterium]
MATRKLVKGNVAICYGAVAARCDAFFGYPITPQNEIPEYMSELMPANGGVFLQAESEVSAINMVYGAACAGKRVMTSSSSPGISLKQEGISYLAACELPCVIVNVQRGGPGLGNTLPGQADYFQTVKGGGHGDYKLLTLAPWSVQECYEFMPLAFDLADKYQNPAAILMDAIIGQMLEPVDMHGKFIIHDYAKTWATNGARGRAHNIINSLWIDPEVMENLNLRMQAKYSAAQLHEVKFHEFRTQDAELVLIAYGSPARICKTVVDMARDEGMAVGLLRPITLFPFPSRRIAELATDGMRFMTVEMSHGQMVEDVRLAVNGMADVAFYGRTGGVVPTPTEILNAVRASFGKPPVVSRYSSSERESQ